MKLEINGDEIEISSMYFGLEQFVGDSVLKGIE